MPSIPLLIVVLVILIAIAVLWRRDAAIVVGIVLAILWFLGVLRP